MFNGNQAQAHLFALTEAELSRSSLSLRFNHQLETQYQDDINQLRNKQFKLVALISLLIFEAICVGIVAKGEIKPGATWAFLLTSQCVVGLPALAAIALFHFGRIRQLGRELLFFALYILVAFEPMLNHHNFAQDGAIGIYFGQVLAIIAFNIAFPMTFKYTVLASSVATLVMSFTAIMYLDASLRTVSAIVETYFAAWLFSLVANYRIEKSERNAYLLMLRESIHNSVISQKVEELARLSQTDTLTELPNRRAYDARLAVDIQKAKDEKTSLSILMIDIDYFKKYNDHYGHLAGDTCLKQVASMIRESCGEGFAARIGGEEFAVILTDCSDGQATAIANQICEAVFSCGIVHANSEIADVVTVSIGIASQSGADGIEVTNLMREADIALYFSKSKGRNSVSLHQSAA